MLRADVTPPPVQTNCTPRASAAPDCRNTLLETVAGQNAEHGHDAVRGRRPAASAGSTRRRLEHAERALTSSLPGFASTGSRRRSCTPTPTRAVQTADSAWNACPGDPNLANGVVSAINQTIATARATYPNVEYVVLVGGDDALPFARIDDLTTVSNENGYAETFNRAERARRLARERAVADRRSVRHDAAGLVPRPPARRSRPGAWSARRVARRRSTRSSRRSWRAGTRGHLHPTTSTTTGYDFLTDGATGVASALATIGTSNTTLISNPWTADDLSQALLTLAGEHPLDQRAREPQPVPAGVGHDALQRLDDPGCVARPTAAGSSSAWAAMPA